MVVERFPESEVTFEFVVVTRPERVERFPERVDTFVFVVARLPERVLIEVV